MAELHVIVGMDSRRHLLSYQAAMATTELDHRISHVNCRLWNIQISSSETMGSIVHNIPTAHDSVVDSQL